MRGDRKGRFSSPFAATEADHDATILSVDGVGLLTPSAAWQCSAVFPACPVPQANDKVMPKSLLYLCGHVFPHVNADSKASLRSHASATIPMERLTSPSWSCSKKNVNTETQWNATDGKACFRLTSHRRGAASARLSGRSGLP